MSILKHKDANYTVRIRKSKRSRILLVIQIALLIFIAILVWKLGSYFYDSYKNKSYANDLAEIAINSDGATDDAQTTETGSAGNAISDTENAADGVPESINFESLKEINDDAVAWIYSPDTVINYVIAQTYDNDYYLHKKLDGSYASGGTLFADYHASGDFSDWNTLIYGHHMKDGSMFASIMNYEDQDYYEEHPVMYLYTPGMRYKMELIAGYTTDTADLVYQGVNSKMGRNTLLTYALERSDFKTDVAVDEDSSDRLVTLSTCSYVYNDARYVLIGRLVEW